MSIFDGLRAALDRDEPATTTTKPETWANGDKRYDGRPPVMDSTGHPFEMDRYMDEHQHAYRQANGPAFMELRRRQDEDSRQAETDGYNRARIAKKKAEHAKLGFVSGPEAERGTEGGTGMGIEFGRNR